MRIPGTMPPAKSFPMEAFIVMPYVTKGIDGGMTNPVVPAAAIRPTANRLSYPSLIMAGIMIDPMATTVAGADPEMAEKNMLARIVTMPRPP